MIEEWVAEISGGSFGRGCQEFFGMPLGRRSTPKHSA